MSSQQIKLRAFTKQEAARYLCVSRATVDRLMARGKISYRKVGVRVCFTIQDLDEFLEREKRAAFAYKAGGNLYRLPKAS